MGDKKEVFYMLLVAVFTSSSSIYNAGVKSSQIMKLEIGDIL
jgi:hypothetical protein